MKLVFLGNEQHLWAALVQGIACHDSDIPMNGSINPWGSSVTEITLGSLGWRNHSRNIGWRRGWKKDKPPTNVESIALGGSKGSCDDENNS